MSDEFTPNLKPFDDAEGPKPALPVPGFWPRLGAFALDAAILSLLAYLGVKNLYPMLYPARWSVQTFALAAPWIYFIVGFSSITGGQTIGKFVFGFRVLSRTTGEYLTFSQAVLRANMAYVCLFGYAFVLQFILWKNFPVHFQENRLFTISVSLLLSALACAYALAASVMTGLHPRKLSFHDMLANSAVVRADDAERGLAFANTPGVADGARIRSAAYPAVVLAVICVFLFAQLYRQIYLAFEKSQPVLLEVRTRLADIEGFSLVGVRGPSAVFHERWNSYMQERVEKYRQLMETGQTEEAQRYTTVTVEGQYTGEEFVFYFDSNAAMTSATLVEHPDYRTLHDRLPAIAEDLSQKHFPPGEEPPHPYTSIHILVREVLPAFLYTEFVMRHFETIAVDTPTTETLDN